MKVFKFIIIIFSIVFIASCFSNKASVTGADLGKPYPLPEQKQYPGNADTGYRYLTQGDYLKSGIPMSIFKMSGLKEKENYLGRTGLNANIPYYFTAIKAPNGEQVVAPNCLYCHSQKIDGKLIVGMGNSLSDYTMPQDATINILNMTVKAAGGKKAEAAAAFLKAGMASNPYIVTHSKGVNVADRLTAILVSHRDPVTFKWSDKEQIKIPEELIPTDVPAWWLLKKKNAMFYNGYGRGDFPRFLMASNLLTVTDTAESAEVLTHFSDVLAYLYSLEPPKYPKAIDQEKATIGKSVFEDHCSSCHGTYGANGLYPNLLIPTKMIGTDSMLVNSNYSGSEFVGWFNKSWFTTGDRPAKLVPFDGYIAPPLDGVWSTAPYLHNASVPNLETLLNSKLRPKFWSRNFENPEYDYEHLGWKFKAETSQTRKSTYNTTLSGYSNRGHYFGDVLTDDERKAVIEYLKTL